MHHRVEPELFGAVALGASAPSIALAAGAPLPFALLLWGLVALRVVPSILWLTRGEPTDVMLPIALHTAECVIAGLIVFTGTAQLPLLFVCFLLLARAVYSLRFKAAMPVGLLAYRNCCLGGFMQRWWRWQCSLPDVTFGAVLRVQRH